MNAASNSALRVAFFGGSFDPPHRGHVGVARAARAALGLDRVLFAPVGAQPLKPGGASASFADRVAMTRLAIAGERGFEISLLDAPRESSRPNFTIDTLELLRGDLPAGSRLFCLMGADSFRMLGQWRRAAEIPFCAELVVASRPGEQLHDLQQALPNGVWLETGSERSSVVDGVELRTLRLTNSAGGRAELHLLPGLEIESCATQIRQRVRGAADAADQVAAPVLQYIGQHHLYQEA